MVGEGWLDGRKGRVEWGGVLVDDLTHLSARFLYVSSSPSFAGRTNNIHRLPRLKVKSTIYETSYISAGHSCYFEGK